MGNEQIKRAARRYLDKRLVNLGLLFSILLLSLWILSCHFWDKGWFVIVDFLSGKSSIRLFLFLWALRWC